MLPFNKVSTWKVYTKNNNKTRTPNPNECYRRIITGIRDDWLPGRRIHRRVDALTQFRVMLVLSC